MKCRFEPGQSLLGAHRVCKSMVNNEFVKLRRNIYKKFRKQYKKDDENGELKNKEIWLTKKTMVCIIGGTQKLMLIARFGHVACKLKCHNEIVASCKKIFYPLNHVKFSKKSFLFLGTIRKTIEQILLKVARIRMFGMVSK